MAASSVEYLRRRIAHESVSPDFGILMLINVMF